MMKKLRREYQKIRFNITLNKTKYLCTGEETTDLILGHDINDKMK